MTRRDYEMVAAAFSKARQSLINDTWEHQHGVYRAAVIVAAALREDNPAFDYNLFMTNAGMRE